MWRGTRSRDWRARGLSLTSHSFVGPRVLRLQSLPSHPHIIQYKHSYLYENDLYLILELAESGDISLLLEQQRQKGTYFQEAEIWYVSDAKWTLHGTHNDVERSNTDCPVVVSFRLLSCFCFLLVSRHYFVQIASALHVMHQCRVMHRDIKPANVFLTASPSSSSSSGSSGVHPPSSSSAAAGASGVNASSAASLGLTIKLGDLGLGRYLSSKTYEAFTVCGTPMYLSPEAISSTGYDFKSDVWSLGCLLSVPRTQRSECMRGE
jgi:serine/threonine protein kinase